MTGVTYVKEKPDLILMHDDNTIAVLDKEKDMPEPSAKVIVLKLVGVWCRKFIVSRFELMLFQLVYNDPRSTPSDDQSQDGSSYCPSLSPSSTKEILGQVGFLPVYGLPPVEGLLKKLSPGLRPSNVQEILSPLGPDAPAGTC